MTMGLFGFTTAYVFGTQFFAVETIATLLGATFFWTTGLLVLRPVFDEYRGKSERPERVKND